MCTVYFGPRGLIASTSIALCPVAFFLAFSFLVAGPGWPMSCGLLYAALFQSDPARLQARAALLVAHSITTTTVYTRNHWTGKYGRLLFLSSSLSVSSGAGTASARHWLKSTSLALFLATRSLARRHNDPPISPKRHCLSHRLPIRSRGTCGDFPAAPPSLSSSLSLRVLTTSPHPTVPIP